jgi:hypothetical protein
VAQASACGFLDLSSIKARRLKPAPPDWESVVDARLHRCAAFIVADGQTYGHGIRHLQAGAGLSPTSSVLEKILPVARYFDIAG